MKNIGMLSLEVCGAWWTCQNASNILWWWLTTWERFKWVQKNGWRVRFPESTGTPDLFQQTLENLNRTQCWHGSWLKVSVVARKRLGNSRGGQADMGPGMERLLQKLSQAFQIYSWAAGNDIFYQSFSRPTHPAKNIGDPCCDSYVQGFCKRAILEQLQLRIMIVFCQFSPLRFAFQFLLGKTEGFLSGLDPVTVPGWQSHSKEHNLSSSFQVC